MTKLIESSQINTENLSKAADILKVGGLVAFPTETVYGLGANGLNAMSVKKIYEAKGRPSDNPLILHIHNVDCVYPLVSNISECAKVLMNKFWPGPLTLVFKKSEIVPDIVSGGLDSVAIRLPNNKIAQELIKLADLPVAAPSANLSGRPSPTKASHVFEDLNGRIDMIIDGGACDIGLESTVVDVTGDSPIILRPGKVTFDDIKELCPTVSFDKHLTEKTEAVAPRSPGMKYKHYAPKGELFILDGSFEKVKEYISTNKNENTGILSFDEFPLNLPNEFSLGSINNPAEGSQRLFDLLRHFDDLNIKTIFALLPPENGIGFALCNRLYKAAGGRIINV